MGKYFSCVGDINADYLPLDDHTHNLVARKAALHYFLFDQLADIYLHNSISTDLYLSPFHLASSYVMTAALPSCSSMSRFPC